MINQQLVRAFLFGALLVPAVNVAMEHKKDAAQEKPTFSHFHQIYMEKPLRVAPYAIPLVAASYCTLPTLISPATNYIKENADYLVKTTVLMIWNAITLYNIIQQSNERLKERPDQRYCSAWLSAAPIVNALAMTVTTDSSLANIAARCIAGYSLLEATHNAYRDFKDYSCIKDFDSETHDCENLANTIKSQLTSYNFSSDPVYSNTLFSRQERAIAKASSLKHKFNELDAKGWLTSEQKNKYLTILEHHDNVIHKLPKNRLFVNTVVSSDLSRNNDEKHENIDINNK